jgi:capsular polysaccharide biosynthesis protein
MPKDFNNWTLAVSRKIYGRLLLAYPKAHREEYGAAMAQLFHDQCRDAWNEARGLGLVKLWLRVLPDLVNTSIAERLSALNQRQSMSDKLANLFRFRQPTPLSTFFTVFAVVFLLVFSASVAITFILPESYASTAQIMVEQDADLRANSPVTDPNFLQTTCGIIQSQLVLESVIDKLNLNAVWGKKYGVGTLKNSETVALLQSMMSLSPIRNTSLLNITVYSADKKEAAVLANAIAESYQDYRDKSHAKLTANGIDILQGGYKKVEITRQAEPGRVPARPNKPLNITVGAIVGIFLALIVGGFAALIAFLIRKRIRKNPATT